MQRLNNIRKSTVLQTKFKVWKRTGIKQTLWPRGSSGGEVDGTHPSDGQDQIPSYRAEMDTTGKKGNKTVQSNTGEGNEEGEQDLEQIELICPFRRELERV